MVLKDNIALITLIIKLFLTLVSFGVPLASLHYKSSGQKPLCTAFAIETLESGSNFDIGASIADLGFHPRPVDEAIKDTVQFLRSIYQIDAGCIIEQGASHRKISDGKATWITLAGAAAGVGLLHLFDNKH